MTPAHQTDTTFTSGNCFAACIATILDLSLKEVPHLTNLGHTFGYITIPKVCITSRFVLKVAGQITPEPEADDPCPAV